jgi:L-threonylcarbamoyladenylate synthase
MKILTSLREPALAHILNGGAVGVLPTDTVYGLATRANNPDAVARLYRLKNREHKPGTVVAANVEQLVALGLNRRSLRAVSDYWPAPLSVVIPCSAPELEYLTQGLRSLAVRVPAHEALQNLLEQTGPLLTSSANHPGQPPADNLAAAQKYFGAQVDFYVDGGDLSGRPSSTVIRIIDDAIEILRHGAVNIDEKGAVHDV